LTGSYGLDLKTKRFTPKFDVTITVRSPIVDKEYTTRYKTTLSITKSFPPYKGQGANINNTENMINNKSSESKIFF
jgi:hypothetical protein